MSVASSTTTRSSSSTAMPPDDQRDERRFLYFAGVTVSHSIAKEMHNHILHSGPACTRRGRS